MFLCLKKNSKLFERVQSFCIQYLEKNLKKFLVSTKKSKKLASLSQILLISLPSIERYPCFKQRSFNLLL